MTWLFIAPNTMVVSQFMGVKALVVHSGGMDSSLCLAHAKTKWGAEHVLSLSFRYGQRHSLELTRAQEICADWQVVHQILDIDCLNEITNNALTRHGQQIDQRSDGLPNTLVTGRNGLMARVAGIHAHELGAKFILMGVIEVESANSGYRDCSRHYMDLVQEVLRMDFADSEFAILTPLVKMTKEQTMEFGHQLGVLEYLLEKTISCYSGVEKFGCGQCPACKLRNKGIFDFLQKNPSLNFSYKDEILKAYR